MVDPAPNRRTARRSRALLRMVRLLGAPTPTGANLGEEPGARHGVARSPTVPNRVRRGAQTAHPRDLGDSFELYRVLLEVDTEHTLQGPLRSLRLPEEGRGGGRRGEVDETWVVDGATRTSEAQVALSGPSSMGATGRRSKWSIRQSEVAAAERTSNAIVNARHPRTMAAPNITAHLSDGRKARLMPGAKRRTPHNVLRARGGACIPPSATSSTRYAMAARSFPPAL